jgi:pimeloyl-[acyl-carrier protein] methyl ester esterase
VTNICLVHGWGVNRAVWHNIKAYFEGFGQVHLLDLPGYGDRTHETFPARIEDAASLLANDIPDNAIVIGWSLGAILALYIQINRLVEVKALQLIAGTPRFTASSGWRYGQRLSNFVSFSESFELDYGAALKAFLLLQFSGDECARQQAKAFATAIQDYPDPSKATLQAGLKVLEHSDLRTGLSEVNVPVQIVCGEHDQICAHGASTFMHQHIAESQLVELDCGHVPFKSCRADFTAATTQWFSEFDVISTNGKGAEPV